MTTPLPFPISDTSDLKRAIRYVSKNDTDKNRRYVMSRAKALGHLDMIPGEWLIPVSSVHTHTSLEKQFSEQSAKYGISIARLKCVYMRGIEDYKNQDIDMGSASMWGLVRVQKYINAVKSGDHSITDDQDLFESAVCASSSGDGLELNIDASNIIADVVYGTGKSISSIFYPGTVEFVSVSDDALHVFGRLNDEYWRYDLNMVDGRHEFVFIDA